MNPKILPFAKSSFVRDIGYAENGPGTGYAKKTWSFSNAATGYSETAIGYAESYRVLRIRYRVRRFCSSGEGRMGCI